MDAIGYMRLSGRDQSKESLEYQERNIRFYCERYHLNLIGLYTDNGQSSMSFDRPNYKALEAYIKKQKGAVRYLIIMDHDRFSRSLTEALQKIDELENKFNLKVLACKEAIDLDTKDPNVFLNRAMDYLLANQELLRIRKRTMDGIRQAHLSGRYVNASPYGYKKVASPEIGNKVVLVPDEAKAALVQRIFQLYKEGMALFAIHRIVKQEGFPNSGNSAIQRILSNCVYAGLIYIPEDKYGPAKYIKGIHQPLVSEADFWSIQERLGNVKPSKVQPKTDFPLRGILKCSCGHYMTAGYSKGKYKYYLYYRCTLHNNKNYSGQKVHDTFNEVMATLNFNEKQVDYIVKTAKAIASRDSNNAASIITARQKSISEIQKKMDKLEERLVNDEIDSAFYKKWHEKFRKDMAMMNDELSQASRLQKDNPVSRIEALAPYLTNMSYIYQLGNLKEQHALIQAVFKQNLTFSDGAFRTPSINPIFAANALIAKEKGLLFVEEPQTIWEQVPSSSEDGS